MKVFKLMGLVLLIVVMVVLAAWAWATSVANQRYQTRWQAHDATFPIPWPLDPPSRDSLQRAYAAAGHSSDAPVPDDRVQAAALAKAVASGKHLVASRVNCTGCHAHDFGGGVLVDIPVVAHWAAPNLTSGEGSVTRGFTSRDWDHAVRHGIRHNGRSSSMPCLDFRNLSDHELSDIVAYIQSFPPVKRDVGAVRFGPVFDFVVATDPKSLPAFVIDHRQPHALEPPQGESAVALGEHIVQICRGCHGPALSGGTLAGAPDMPTVGNITPHATGLKGWSERDFFHALRDGKRPDGSSINEAMPWKVYGQMSDTELSAVWAYLQTVPPRAKGNH